jgi:hypothetical protein
MNRAPRTQRQPKTKKTAVTKKQPVKKVSKRAFRTSTPTHATLYSHTTVLSEAPQEESSDYVVENPLHISPMQAQLFAKSAPIYVGPLGDRNAPGMANLWEDRKSAVTIYHPCKNAMQNQKNDDFRWKIREHRSRADLTNQLAGDDYVALSNQYYPRFESKEHAIAYCEMEGLEYVVEPEPVRKYDLRSYADNFKWKGKPDATSDL